MGRLAEIILLEQFSRNMFRESAQSFSYDGQALAQFSIAQGLHDSLTEVQRSFLYLPFMHSESLIIHQQAEQLYKANGVARILTSNSSISVLLNNLDVTRIEMQYLNVSLLNNKSYY